MKALLQPIQPLIRFFDESMKALLSSSEMAGKLHDVWHTQLRDEARELIVSVAVPGMTKEDLMVYTQGGVLVIEPKKPIESNANYPSMERHFKHYFVLPEQIDVNRISATCRRGILTINIPRIQNKKGRTRINVLEGEQNTQANIHTGSVWDKLNKKIDVWKFHRLTNGITWSWLSK